tara:strand:+ start:27 stop:437 length:411 start_codon:yes stop_codon:yes gene_type:complete
MNKDPSVAKYINVHVVFPVILYVIQLLIIPLHVAPTLYPSMHHKWLAAFIQMPNLRIWCSVCLHASSSDIGGAIQDGLHEEELLDFVPYRRRQIDHGACVVNWYWVGGIITNLKKKVSILRDNSTDISQAAAYKLS